MVRRQSSTREFDSEIAEGVYDRDVTGKQMTDPVQDALTYADNIIATLREPFVVLDKSLRVRTANAAFYRDFQVSKEETEGRFVYELGNGQWDIPQLRTLLPRS